TVLDGVYTAAQATRGEVTFRDRCSACHYQTDFAGATFQQVWGEYSVGDLFRQVSTAMPMDNPGSLEGKEYADILAYFLSLNGYPAGETELPAEIEKLFL